MATADVMLPEAAANTLSQASAFVYNVPIQTAAVVPNASATTPATIDKEYFILNTQSFIDLQLYVKAGLRLPNSTAAFDREFPRALFANYKDSKTPVLYDMMSATLVNINNHCFNFQNDTLNPMVSLAGYIANYTDTAGKRSVELVAQMKIIQAKLADTSDIAKAGMKEAVEEAQSICLELSDEAKNNKAKCADLVKALGTFRTTTEQDKNALDALNERSSIVLPTTAKLNEDLRKQMDTVRDELNSLAKTENKQREKAKANSGARWYYAVPWVGWGLAISDTVKKADAENAVRAARKKYEEVAAKAGQDLAAAISFRERCKNLTDMIRNVTEYISAAITALTHMIGAFSTLETDLEDIANKLDTVNKYVGVGSSTRMTLAFKRLAEAGAKWTKVSGLARDFQRNGLLMEANVKAEAPPAEAPPQLEITCAHYGGVEYTAYAKILFNEGENLRVHSVEPGFPEPWEGVKKSISFTYVFGKERRIFTCREYSGDHDLKIGPIENSRDGRCEVSVVQPRPKPTGSKVEILAIIYGAKEIKNPKVDQYCYKQFQDGGNIEWNNDKMGEDPWLGTEKSGTIYFVRNGSSVVEAISGRERSSTAAR